MVKMGDKLCLYRDRWNGLVIDVQLLEITAKGVMGI